MVLPDSHGISRVPRYSGTVSSEIKVFRLRDYHPLWLSVPEAFDYTLIFLLAGLPQRQPHNPVRIATHGLGYSRFARRYSGNLV